MTDRSKAVEPVPGSFGRDDVDVAAHSGDASAEPGAALVDPGEEDRRDEGPAGSRLWVHVVLFLTTCVTTTFWGAVYAGAGWATWWKGLSYSAPLMGILLTHEMGHYLAARHHRIPASLPYFIPFPFGLGTLGAVISMKGRIESRNALVDVGAAGPLAGFVVAVVVLLVGLSQSTVGTVPPGSSLATEGNSILYILLKFAVTGRYLPSGGLDVFLTPMALAGWIGFLVTMINLIPVGQLDGGHVAYAFFGERYQAFSRRLHRFLPVMAVAVMAYVTIDALGQIAPQPPNIVPAAYRLWPLVSWRSALTAGFFAGFPWLLWPGLLWLLSRTSGGIDHPPVGQDELTRGRRVIAWTVGLLFLLIFTPVPMRGL
ncbi:MAG: site-2 protease family protein [Deltaproteobacteria bacterium]|nr:site-2 protease family protein [Deltaproteobacteria bacterium]